MAKSASKRSLSFCLCIALASLGVACVVNESSSPGSLCSEPGEGCSSSDDCCQSGLAYGQVCVANNGRCSPVCYGDSECQSGCCAMLYDVSYGACSDWSACG
jgi:hypothetical protein